MHSTFVIAGDKNKLCGNILADRWSIKQPWYTDISPKNKCQF